MTQTGDNQMKQKVGFIGLGEMGKWMAINVAKAGFPLTVYDIRPNAVSALVEKGAISAKNPTEVVRKADNVLLSLPDTQVVEEVIFGKNGLIGGLSSGSVLVDLSTIDYLTTVKIGQELRDKGVTFIDAPVSGMEARAKEGTLCYGGGRP
jgi:3-hydroxyisobutyrate dehydrogenase-like beta-hydroxyacid dehydrogenase